MYMFNFLFFVTFSFLLPLQFLLQLISLIKSLQPSLVTLSLFTSVPKAGTCGHLCLFGPSLPLLYISC